MDEPLISHVNISFILSLCLLYPFGVFPDAGVVGDYHKARILVRNNSEGFISGLIGSRGTYIKEGEVLNATANSTFSLLIVTAWPSRIVFVEVVSGRDNVLAGFNPR